MSDVRTFKAASMHEALQLVRNELGGDAVILHTRHVERRRRLPWLKPRQEVLVTAGLGVNVPSRAFCSEDPAAAAAAVQPPHSGHSIAPPDEALVPGTTTLGSGSADESGDAEFPASLANKLDSMQKMLEQLGRTCQVRSQDEIPDELFHLYAELIDAEVEDDLARELVFRLKQTTTAEALGNGQSAKALLTHMVESELRCGNPIRPTRGKRHVVALVGPTGVGKTTTIAKLAANFRIRDGIRMGLVTVDTYRIAAVEQLRTYAEIIDLPMKVVTSPREMRRALDELAGLDLVLIDTAGRSPRDELKIQELKSLLAEAQVDEVHLVLSMTGSVRSLEATAEKFSVANTTSVILTKLDEAAGLGTLLSVSRKIPLPISYITTGQDVPDDIEPVQASRMARLVLGDDKLYS